MLIDYMNMTDGEYHEKQLTYYIKSFQKEFDQNFEGQTFDPKNEKHQALVKSLPYVPFLVGDMSKSLGLDGKLLDVDLWRALANGYAPSEDGQDTPAGKLVKLRRTANPIDQEGNFRPDLAAKESRIGTEFVFGHGQNTSNVLEALFLDDPSKESAYQARVQEIFAKHIVPEITKDAMVATGTDGVDLGYASEVLMAVFPHGENRATDCYKHVHAVLLNTARGEDRNLYAVKNDLICKNKDKYNYLFQRHINDWFKSELGLVLKPIYLKDDLENVHIPESERNIVAWDVADDFMPESLKNAVSARQKEIDEELRKQGLSGHNARELARLETRDEKTDLTPAELKAKWRQTFNEHGFSADSFKDRLDFNQAPSDELVANERLHKMTEAFMRKHLNVEFSEDQLKAHIFKQLINTHSHEMAERIAEDYFAKECMLVLDKSQESYFAPLLNDDPELTVHDRQQKQIRYGRDVRFTTRTCIRQDSYIVDSANARKDETGFVMDKKEITKGIIALEIELSKNGKQFQFSMGQKDAIIKATTQPGSLMTIEGRAGSGKSTALAFIKDTYEKKGYNVLGTALASQATRELGKSAKMNKGSYMNTTELLLKLDKGLIKLDSKSVLMVDEAGMCDTATLFRISEHVNRAGAKQILIGESLQLQPVGAGGVFKKLSENFTCAPVTEINRQKEHWQREMVENFALGKSDVAMQSLYDNGKIVIAKTHNGRINALVRDYLADPKPVTEKFAIAMTNNDVETLNFRIRGHLIKEGKLDPLKSCQVKCSDGFTRDFALGDRLVFTKAQKSDDAQRGKLLNSETATVVAINRWLSGKPSALKIRTDDGKEHYLNVTSEHNIKHGYAITTHKSQGGTKDNTYILPSSTMNNLHTSYVALSRHRESAKIYLSEDMCDQLAKKVENKSPSPKMLRYAKSIATKKNLEWDSKLDSDYQATREFINAQLGVKTEKNVLEDFKSLITSMSQTQFKKSTFDFALMDDKAQSLYKSIRNDRHSKVYKPQMAVKEELRKEQIQSKQPSHQKSLSPNINQTKKRGFEMTM